MEETIKIHNHPKMEKDLGVPLGHVIIDEELFYELLRRFGISLPDWKDSLKIE